MSACDQLARHVSVMDHHVRRAGRFIRSSRLPHCLSPGDRTFLGAVTWTVNLEWWGMLTPFYPLFAITPHSEFYVPIFVF